MRILYVDIDTLRPDHLGCYGYGRNTSPNIDRVAREESGGRTSMDSSIEAHMMAFAAEKSRKESIVVNMEAFRKEMLG